MQERTHGLCLVRSGQQARWLIFKSTTFGRILPYFDITSMTASCCRACRVERDDVLKDTMYELYLDQNGA